MISCGTCLRQKTHLVTEDGANMISAAQEGVPSGKRLQKTNWKTTILSMGKSTISTGPWLQ
jgi:hypothetical protein